MSAQPVHSSCLARLIFRLRWWWLEHRCGIHSLSSMFHMHRGYHSLFPTISTWIGSLFLPIFLTLLLIIGLLHGPKGNMNYSRQLYFGPYLIYLVPLYLVGFANQTEQKYRRNSGRAREKFISRKCPIQIAAPSYSQISKQRKRLPPFVIKRWPVLISVLKWTPFSSHFLTLPSLIKIYISM